ncbi:hypothetical protein FKP32DRAFT_1580955 [Trametes sanguinea]|nr:hypothetical protein FKP32DRAFT_1580955 [Trametes sanguinea]
MLRDLEGLLQAKGISFHSKGNRLRCFSHVVNIAVKHGLAALTDTNPSSYMDSEADTGSTPPQAQELPSPHSSDDPRARQLVNACRASGQRCEDFMATITEGNRTEAFGQGKSLRAVQLLRDVNTWWSSTFLMIDRLLELYPTVLVFMESPRQSDISYHLLNEAELQVLQDIRGFLLLPHLVQELLSAEQTPTASQAIPAYERLLNILNLARIKYPKIAHGIEASITAIKQYMCYTRQTRAYALAMSA